MPWRSLFWLLLGVAVLLVSLFVLRGSEYPMVTLASPVLETSVLPSPVAQRQRLRMTATAGPRILALLRDLDIDHVVIWGHPLDSHTHSYIHEAFVLAARSLGLDVHWVPVPFQRENEPPPVVDYTGPTTRALFLTEGQVVTGLPQDPQSWYILHNVDTPLPGIPAERRLALQYYTPARAWNSHPVFDEFHRLSDDYSEAIMPWATNLLPEQFRSALPKPRIIDRNIVVIGQAGPIYEVKINKFAETLPEARLDRIEAGCTQEKMMDAIQRAWCAPALMNQWQKDNGYIPCRIMKNISYGAIPVTTSEESYRMLYGNALYDADEAVLAQKFRQAVTHNEDWKIWTRKAAQLVQTRHTYLNRWEFLLTCLKLRYQKLGPQATVAPAAPTVLHLTCHRGCQKYLDSVAAQLGWQLKTLFLPDFRALDSVYNMTAEKADRAWLLLKDQIQTFDHVVVSDTAPLSRIVLQHLDEYTGRVTVWVCNRFDYAHGHDEAFPDPGWYDLVRQYHERVRFVSYTRLERMYALDRDVVWDNAFADATIRPVCRVDPVPPAVSALPAEVQAAKSDYLFIPPYVNDEKLIDFNFLQQHHILHYRGRYNGASDLLGFKAILHIPYAPSNLALFENLSLGMVYYIPSLTFMLTLLQQHPWFSTGNITQNVQASEWYDARHRDLFVYFDSWDDLAVQLAASAHSAKVERVQAWTQREEQHGLFQWQLLIT